MNETKQIKISQYADDTKLFLKNQESEENVLRFIENLNKTTGTTINLEKTTFLSINTNYTLKIIIIIIIIIITIIKKLQVLQLKNNMKQLKF